MLQNIDQSFQFARVQEYFFSHMLTEEVAKIQLICKEVKILFVGDFSNNCRVYNV